MESILKKERELEDFFRKQKKIAVAFSGGVDSAYLLYVSGRSGAESKAYYVKTDFQPEFELEDAKRLAEEQKIPMQVISLNILGEERIAANPSNRCYYCKSVIFSAIKKAAEADGAEVLCDGTNASDDAGDRPGMVALRELSVRSPLRECGLTKSEIRKLSRKAGLFTWDKPAYACLATRIPSGTVITGEILERTDRAEEYMKSLGFSDFRVRFMNGAAKLQLREEQLPLLLSRRQEIRDTLGKDYSGVFLDLEVRK